MYKLRITGAILNKTDTREYKFADFVEKFARPRRYNSLQRHLNHT
jgi:hypothetical protein